MSRGLTDLPEPEQTEDQDNAEIEQVIRDLIIGQNKLHDRLIDLERKLDHLNYEFAVRSLPDESVKPEPKRWKLGL